MLIRAGITVIKYWFSVSDEEQEKRFKERINTPIKRWKFSPMDLQSRSRWVEYSRAKDDMFTYTDTEDCPWFVVEADDKRRARLNCISHLLGKVPYEAIHYEPITLPPSTPRGMSAHRWPTSTSCPTLPPHSKVEPCHLACRSRQTAGKKPVLRPAKGIESKERKTSAAAPDQVRMYLAVRGKACSLASNR